MSRSIYLYSPFTVKNVAETQNRALLLQFILSELFHAKNAYEGANDPLEFVFSSPACFFPYDLAYEVGCLNKIHEHATLLEYAFPTLGKEVSLFHSCLDKILAAIAEYKRNNKEVSSRELLSFLKDLYLNLQPFIIQCKENENLLLFLFKTNHEISSLAYPEDLSDLLTRMFPEGLDRAAEYLRLQYKKRGFTSLIAEIEHFLTSYEK